ncbi:hypothetical protein O9Z70_06520 [Devosia sp. YIM 151766]|uniref:hypothetical protein n=1 Tax=Devosia sp. YIM 151766 TaxID=3017325 RepID=UPI00255D079A|nr:hypothetical protein [Devosia sp. YIM 151766]WIY54171.1 hypothetical protein O9Z70_06520 [Devosia sp. YIM 151766]
MTAPKFDLTINLGHVLTFGGLIVTMTIGWATFDGRLRAVEKTLETATNTLIEQVRQGGELRALTQRLDRVERIVDNRP